MRLTIGMRCKIKPSSSWYTKGGHNEALLQERSGDSFSFLGLGQKELKKEDPQTVTGGGAWINEDELEHIDSDFETNLDFMDWYEEHEEDFCGDCGAWFPENGSMGEPSCPNEKCPGNKHAKGCCPYCDPDVELNDKGICPKCEWKEMY
jgi:hypothetical protein